MPIPAVAHIAISTPDLERAVEFWAAVGFNEVRRWAWHGLDVVDELTGLCDSAASAVLMEGFGCGIELFEFTAPPQTSHGAMDRPVSDHGITHLCLTVDDLDAERARLGAAGMTFWAESVTDPRGAKMTYGRDPDGNVIELVQPAPPARTAEQTAE